MLDFSVVVDRLPELLWGCPGTLGLAVAGMMLAMALGLAGVVTRGSRHRALRVPTIGFIELIRNTPFMVQIFFLFFALPGLGIRLNPTVTAILALGVNGGAYAIEIIRGGVQSIGKGQVEAGLALGLHRAQVFRLVVLKPALRAIYPSLAGQFILLTLTSSIGSSISAFELTSVAQRIESDTFRSFEVYFTITVMYLTISWMVMTALAMLSRGFLSYPTLEGARHVRCTRLWRVQVLVGRPGVDDAAVGDCLRQRRGSGASRRVGAYVEAARPSPRRVRLHLRLQRTPLLMQLFCVYYGLGLFGIQLPAWVAVAVAFTLNASAFLGEIWRGAIQAVSKGQTEAASALGLHYSHRMRHIVLPQAFRIAQPATVGYLVQLIKGTSLAAIVGFIELTRAGQIVANQTYAHILVLGVVGALYFALCLPLTIYSGRLERRLAAGAR